MKKDFFNYCNAISNEIEAEALDKLFNCFHRRSLMKDDYFSKKGEYAQKVGFLLNGVIRAFYLNEQGKEYNKQFFVGPSLIGAYTSLLTKTPNLIPQQALTDCEILEADYQQIEKLYSQHHSLERLGRKISEHYFLEKEKKELEMGLLEGEERYTIFQKDFPNLEQQIPQFHIASYLGISATQLSRIRKGILKSGVD
ncbi:Crp/Fnr family transcriptional regulator [Flammeovirga aprica]|uniref:Crp/Fnr family transcriptional regulator n=1 Tax=Flammeovirga aprica JL-4 TaxID=694437 RepID=A0A7X9XAM1_9BACT|nr:Crp/Fnr family transcriptional regulator [Flammeovirga aprica]NME69820.1 Crp/Fnr family transcriptional regulator [Flammeovirga aprica JL-4]